MRPGEGSLKGPKATIGPRTGGPTVPWIGDGAPRQLVDVVVDVPRCGARDVGAVGLNRPGGGGPGVGG